MSTVITTTGVTGKQIDKFGLTVDKACEVLNATKLIDEPVKKDMKLGRYLLDTPTGFKIYTVEDVDVDKQYSALTKEEQTKCWTDGFKRQHVNRPAHEAVKSGLGIKEQSAGTKAVLKAKGVTLDHPLVVFAQVNNLH